MSRRSKRYATRAVETFGRVDIMVCAAGVTKRVPTLTMAEADWNRIIETNLTGTLRACQRVRRATWSTAASGRIITIASLDVVRRHVRGCGLHGQQGGGCRADARAGR